MPFSAWELAHARFQGKTLIMSIGPQIPPQFQRPDDDADDGGGGPQPSIGPRIPTHLLAAERSVKIYDDDDAEPVGPALPTISKGSPEGGDHGHIGPSSSRLELPSRPPSLSTSGNPPPRKRIIGPSFPMHPSAYDSDSDSDIGPKPLPAGQSEQPDPVKEFIEKEEKRKKAVQEALKPKAPKRDEWMLVPPTASSLLGNLDPSKLKARQFSRGKTTQPDNNMSLWTETPAERQQRLADEVQGKKRRVTDAAPEDDEESERKRRRKREEEGIRRGVDDYTKKRRGPALVDQHKETLAKKPVDKEQPPGIWDHTRDMGVGGRLMDDDKRGKMLNEAKGLGDRFNSGKSGGFL